MSRQGSIGVDRHARVGYYVHHQGRGHAHRAVALGRVLGARGVRVTFLSSLEDPGGLAGWGDWVRLPRDDDGEPVDAAPGGLLHWAPRRHAGLRDRAAEISHWIGRTHPDLVVSDVSQEVTLLCRLHGVPVVSVVLPGDRGDAAHRLGLGVSDRLVGFWPQAATQMVSGLPDDVLATLAAVGALSRFAPEPQPGPAASRAGSPRLLVLSGRGGDAWPADELRTFVAARAGWQVDVVGPDHWVSDPWPLLRAATVVVTRAGQASIAEVAAARVPAVVVPARRPHDEQDHTGAQLAGGAWPALVRPRLSAVTSEDLASAGRLDGSGWESWCDGRAAERFADLVTGLLEHDPAPAPLGGLGGLGGLAVR